MEMQNKLQPLVPYIRKDEFFGSNYKKSRKL